MKKMYSILTGLFALFMPITTVKAQDIAPQIGIKQPPSNVGVQIGNSSAAELLSTVIRNAIGLIFTFAGIAFVFVFFWGVIDWILAAGDKEKIAAGRRKITQSIIGIIILALSFVIFAVLGKVTGINLLGDITLPSFTNP